MRRPRILPLATALATALALALGSALAPAARAGAPDAGDAQAPPGASAAPPAAAREKLEGPRLDALLADVAKARKAVRTLRASFTQERRISLLATTIRSTGELVYVAPDRLRWELAAPDDVVYLVGPEGLSYRTKSSHATLPQSGANVTKALADLRALLGGDLSVLRERYVLSASRTASDVEITGAAKDRASSVRGFTLSLDKTLAVATRARLLEGKSDAIDITFSNAQINAAIDPASVRP